GLTARDVIALRLRTVTLGAMGEMAHTEETHVGKANAFDCRGPRPGVCMERWERECAGRLHDHVALVQGRRAPCDQERRQQQAESELRRRERFAGAVLVESA